MHRITLAVTLALHCAGCGGSNHAVGGAPRLDGGASANDLGARPRQPDLGMPAGGGDLGRPTRFGCKSDINCYVMDKCADQACLSNCDAMVDTPDGVRFVNEYLDCLFGNANAGKTGACPDTGGGVCDSTAANYNQASCTTCIGMAKMGSCRVQTQNCANDG